MPAIAQIVWPVILNHRQVPTSSPFGGFIVGYDVVATTLIIWRGVVSLVIDRVAGRTCCWPLLGRLTAGNRASASTDVLFHRYRTVSILVSYCRVPERTVGGSAHHCIASMVRFFHPVGEL